MFYIYKNKYKKKAQLKFLYENNFVITHWFPWNILNFESGVIKYKFYICKISIKSNQKMKEYKYGLASN